MTTLQRKDAEILALQALSWVMSQQDVAAACLDACGATPDSLRSRAGDPDFLAGVMDFLLSSDDLVRGFAAEAGRAPEAILRARRALPGGETLDW